MKEKFEEHTCWTVSSVTQCCKKHHYYESGNNEEFANMLNFVFYHPYSLEALETVAIDIWKHSSKEDDIKEIAFYLSLEAVYRTYIYRFMEGIND